MVWSRKDDFVSDIVSESDAICSKSLKAEAVKWANKTGVSMTAIEFIEQFFNITEEDLK